MTTAKKYPLICSFREIIVGAGFVGGIAINGRVLAEDDGESWWVYGVYPGAVAGAGRSLGAAMTDFRNRVKSVFIDLAHEAADFDVFSRMIKAFFVESDEVTVEEWSRARDAIRSGAIELPGMQTVRQVPDPEIEVVMLQLQPTVNAVDDGPALAA